MYRCRAVTVPPPADFRQGAVTDGRRSLSTSLWF